MMSMEIWAAVASIITIFTAGVAVGRYIESSKNDRRQFGRHGDRFYDQNQFLLTAFGSSFVF